MDKKEFIIQKLDNLNQDELDFILSYVNRINKKKKDTNHRRDDIDKNN